MKDYYEVLKEANRKYEMRTIKGMFNLNGDMYYIKERDVKRILLIFIGKEKIEQKRSEYRKQQINNTITIV